MRYAADMRTTIDIDDDLLLTVKEIARQQKKPAGDVVSTLLRRSLQPRSFRQNYRNRLPLLPRRPRGATVTSELVHRLRDQDE
jgi:hypothetical protein